MREYHYRLAEGLLQKIAIMAEVPDPSLESIDQVRLLVEIAQVHATLASCGSDAVPAVPSE